MFKSINIPALRKILPGVALVLAAMAGQAATAGSCPVPANAKDLLAAAEAQMAEVRRDLGVRPVRRNARLDKAAQQQACFIARQGGYDPKHAHAGSGGSTPMKRVKRTGYRACLTAENLAMNFFTAEATFGAWMTSPGHRSNMALPAVRDYGLGLAMAGNQPVWILVLAKGC